MPAPEIAYRRQKAILWEATGNDAYGQPQVNPIPVELDVRWNTRQVEALDPQGNTITLDAVVVVDRKIAIGSIMLLGTLLDWYGSGSAGEDEELMEVKTYVETPDLKNRETRRTVGLMRYKGVLP